MSSISEDWDVEKHKTEHECDEHWELRRKFLLAHKDKFPEDELVCLAQVFTNVELLGCKYPKETMQLIAELTEDVAKEYREKQKSKLKRTFVQASDAASSKFKGLQAPTTNTTVIESTSNSTNTTSSGSQSLNTIPSALFDSANITNTAKCSLQSRNGPVPALRDHEAPSKKAKLDLPFGDIVLVERPGDMPQSILAVAVSGNSIEWKFKTVNNLCECSILINSTLLAEARETNQKAAKKEAAIKGISELQKYYYTIKVKQKLNGEANITATSMLHKTTPSKKPDVEDNIGKKLMKLMGWAGGGLGKSQQGITEPVTLNQQVNRQGLGLKGNNIATNDLRNMCKEKFKEFLKGDMKKDLVFSHDFSNEERAVIHQVARYMGLKSQSYGPKNQRTLVISQKIDIRDLVEELKSLGGVTDKYELIEPRP